VEFRPRKRSGQAAGGGRFLSRWETTGRTWKPKNAVVVGLKSLSVHLLVTTQASLQVQWQVIGLYDFSSLALG